MLLVQCKEDDRIHHFRLKADPMPLVVRGGGICKIQVCSKKGELRPCLVEL